MILDELLWIINDSTVVKLYDANQNHIASYDGKDAIPEYLNEYDVNDIFADEDTLCGFYKNIPCIGIEINYCKEEEI